VWAWGYNAYGELGDDTHTNSDVPVRVHGLGGVVALAAGYSHSLALKADARFLTAGPARIILFTPIGRPEPDVACLRDRGVTVYEVGEERVDLPAALSKLSDLGIRRVLVEGGGSLNFELLRLGLVDEITVYVAPLILGGATAPTLADGPGLVRDLALSLSRVEVETWEDGGLVLRYKVKQRE